MKLFQNSSILSFLAISLFITILTGCGSDHDHGPTPIGLVLSVDATDIAIQEETNVTYLTGNPNHIEVDLGTTLGPISVEFILESGERYIPDTNDGYSLQYNVSNNNAISLGPVLGGNEWTLQLTGNVVSEPGEPPTITFELWHLDHSDFESRPFQVRVVEPQIQD